VQALERLIGSKVSKASQLVLDRPAEADDTSAVEELFRSDGSDMLLAVPSASNPIEATAKANDIAVLREEFARLAAQVRIQEGRFGPWSLALERDVSELRKMISNMKEQMEGRSRESVAERALDLEQMSLGASLGIEFRRELDDQRERCATLTSIVEDLAKAQTRLADSTLAQSTRRYLDADASTVFGPEAQQLCAKVAEETARRVALETRAVSVDSAKDAARKVAEETAGAIVDVAGAVQNEVAQLRQRQGEMLKEMATFRGRPDASASESILADVKASFADAFTRLETSCRSAHTSVSQHREEHLAKHEDLMAKIKASDDAFKNLETSCRTAHDAISRHRDEHRAKHEDLIAKIAASELNVAGLQSRFEHFFAQEHLHSPKALSKLADKTDSPAPATSTMRPQELVELRSDLDAALRDMRELRVERERNSMALTSGLQDLTSWRADIERDVEKLKEERERNSRAFAGGLQDMKTLQGDMERSLKKLEEERTSIDSMLIVDTPGGQVALTSLPGELEELRLQLERIVRELREEKASMTESALAAVEKSRTEQLSSSLQSFRQDIETAISGIRQDVSKVETSCVERIQSSSLQIVRDEMQTVVGTLSKSFAETTERLQSQLQLQQVQQATPRLAADVDTLREELEALQEKLQSQLQQQQVHQVQQATLRLAGDVAALRTELEAMRERLQSQLQLQQVQQATPPPTADVDALRAELEALRERADVAVIKSELQTLQEDRVVHQSAIDEGVVFIASRRRFARRALGRSRGFK
jgi:predicted  nucleic acid-binding Zn-ribbon protein